MKLLTVSIALVCLSISCLAQEFTLQDDKGKTNGPFALKVGTEVTVGASKAVIAKVRTQKQQVLDDLREIVIPQIDFKQASLRDVVAYLQQAASKADPKKRAINLVFGFTEEQEKALMSAKITFTAREIPLLDALKIVTELANVKYGVRGSVVTVLPLDAPDGDMFIRTYTVMPNVIERATGVSRCLAACSTNQPADLGEQQDLKKLFSDLGVPWPVGSSIAYLSIIGKLRVCNTRENLELFEKVLEEMNVTPREIQIDVQFVAFDLTNINQLVAAGPGISTASLTALWVAGKGELLAAPSVVTKAGQEAVVKGVTEYIYPTQFTVTGLQLNTNATGSAMSEPGSFQTRETGAILQVVPEVSAEGQMINLTFNPQIVEDPVWEDYGATIRDGQKELHIPMRQPFFHVHSASTSVSIYNGKRVLVGGGMPSRDKKRAVYLFVTATLVDPAGKVIKIPSDREEMDVPVK